MCSTKNATPTLRGLQNQSRFFFEFDVALRLNYAVLDS